VLSNFEFNRMAQTIKAKRLGARGMRLKPIDESLHALELLWSLCGQDAKEV
jgi:hypothetical protein